MASNLPLYRSLPEGTMTTLKTFTTPAVLVAAFALTAAPSFAQQKYHGRESSPGQQSGGQPSGGQPSGGQQSGQQSSGQSRERAQPRSEAPRAQTEAPRPQAGAPPRVETRQETPRAQQPQEQRQTAQPRGETRDNQNRGNDNRGNDNRRNDNRGYGNRGYENRRDEGRAVPRGNVYAPHYEPYNSPRYSPRGYGYYGSRSYYRPYVFRPRYSIGFGIFSGYPVPYAYSYSAPIWVYGYRAPRERVFVTPGSPYYGGIALEMTPYDADVFVDGIYAGRVEDFDGATQPLTLSAGVHEIEVQAQGYEPMRINVEVQPGQVIPYRGDLRPY